MSILVWGCNCSFTVCRAASLVAKCTTSPPLMAAPSAMRCRLGADSDHKVDAQHGRQRAGVEVGLIRQIAQLPHIAQHRHPALAVRAAQYLQRRALRTGDWHYSSRPAAPGPSGIRTIRIREP